MSSPQHPLTPNFPFPLPSPCPKPNSCWFLPSHLLIRWIWNRTTASPWQHTINQSRNLWFVFGDQSKVVIQLKHSTNKSKQQRKRTIAWSYGESGLGNEEELILNIFTGNISKHRVRQLAKKEKAQLFLIVLLLASLPDHPGNACKITNQILHKRIKMFCCLSWLFITKEK